MHTYTWLQVTICVAYAHVVCTSSNEYPFYALTYSCTYLIQCTRGAIDSSVKWTWAISAFSTNKRSENTTIRGLQSHVWSGPKLTYIIQLSMEVEGGDVFGFFPWEYGNVSICKAIQVLFKSCVEWGYIRVCFMSVYPEAIVIIVW